MKMNKILLIMPMMFLLLFDLALAANESISVTTMKCLDGAYEVVNDSIKCVTCASGFEAINGTCTLKTKQLNTETPKNNLVQRFDKFIDDNGTQIAPANPALGKVVLFAVAIIFFYFLLVGVGKILRGRK